MNSLIPDWTRLSCFRLLFLAARPARWLRPFMTPPGPVTPRDGWKHPITNFLFSQSVRDAKTQNSHTVFTTSLLLVEAFWGCWDEIISLITCDQDQHSAYNYQQRKDPQQQISSFILVMTVSFWGVYLDLIIEKPLSKSEQLTSLNTTTFLKEVLI